MTTTPAPNSTRRASDMLYDEVAASRNSLRRENIRLIKEVCDRMEKDKAPISVAEVVRRCGVNGPAYSTVSNQGSQLGEYIKLRIGEQAANLGVAAGTQSLSDTVSDPVLQARIRDTESTARWATRENDGLRALLKSLRPGVNIDALIRKASDPPSPAPVNPELPAPSSGPDRKEVSGLLLKLMDHLVGSRQYKQTRGRLTINGKVVLDPRELKIYREATGLAEEAWQARYGDTEEKGGSHG
jgi:hypothetical protein